MTLTFLKRYEIVLVFLFLVLACVGNIENICKYYLQLTFDNQALLFWDYSASVGHIPYKDIFYPYGLLFYYKNTFLPFSFIYFLLSPIIFTCIFLFFRIICKERLLAYIFSLLFLLFILQITGLETFTRYGVAVGMVCVYSYIYTKFKKVKLGVVFSFGTLSGLLFTLLNDQGFYSIILFLWFLVFNQLLVTKPISHKIFAMIKYGSVFACGILLGLLPLLLFLYYHQALSHFIAYLRELSTLPLLAKTPFIHSLRSFENLFILFTLITAIFVLTYKYMFTKEKGSYITHFQLGMVGLLILLEQKSLIRSLDTQITFVAFLLLLVLYYEFITFFYIKQKKATIIIYLMTIFLYLILRPVDVKAHTFYNPLKILSVLNTISNNQCVTQNLSNVVSNYQEIKDYFDKKPNKHEKIFSFPGEPFFYVLFTQIPPFYPTIYESSSIAAQQRQITYIKTHHVGYVLYNYKNPAIQDGVPNYIRAPILHKYIFNNFFLETIKGEFLVLKRKKEEKKLIQDTFPVEFTSYLFTVNLANIPRSEGYHKNKNLDSKEIIPLVSLKEFNKNLQEKNISSSNKFLLVRFISQQDKKEKITLRIKTNNNPLTIINFYACEIDIPCIINLSYIPIFYSPQIIQEIDSSADVHVELFEEVRKSDFW